MGRGFWCFRGEYTYTYIDSNGELGYERIEADEWIRGATKKDKTDLAEGESYLVGHSIHHHHLERGRN